MVTGTSDQGTGARVKQARVTPLRHFYASRFRHCGHYVFGLFSSQSICLSREVSRHFPDNAWREYGLKFCRLMYLDHLQNWLNYGHGLLIFLLLAPLGISETVKFGVSGHFPENRWREWPEILHADVSRPPSELIRLWSWSVDFDASAFRRQRHYIFWLSVRPPGSDPAVLPVCTLHSLDWFWVSRRIVIYSH